MGLTAEERGRIEQAMETAFRFLDAIVWTEDSTEADAMSVMQELREAAALLTASPVEGTPEQVAQRFHEAYERLAPSFGYETREASRKPWADVPEQNKRLMIAVCAEVLAPPLTTADEIDRDDLFSAVVDIGAPLPDGARCWCAFSAGMAECHTYSCDILRKFVAGLTPADEKGER